MRLNKEHVIAQLWLELLITPVILVSRHTGCCVFVVSVPVSNNLLNLLYSLTMHFETVSIK